MTRVAILAALILGLAAPAGAWAQRGDDTPAPAPRQEQEAPAPRAAPAAAAPAARNLPLAQIIAMIAQRTPGKQLDTKLEQSDGVAVYRIIWSTTDGRRIDYTVNAQTGRILSQEGG